MLRRTSWLIATALVALAAIAAVAAAPSNLAKTIEAQRRLTVERPASPPSELGFALKILGA